MMPLSSSAAYAHQQRDVPQAYSLQPQLSSANVLSRQGAAKLAATMR
jgi:hypothetical protein